MGYDSWKCTDVSWVDYYEEEVNEELESRITAENHCDCEISEAYKCKLCSRDNRYYQYCYETKKLIKIA